MELQNRLYTEYQNAQQAQTLSEFMDHFFVMWKTIINHDEGDRIIEYIKVYPERKPGHLYGERIDAIREQRQKVLALHFGYRVLRELCDSSFGDWYYYNILISTQGEEIEHMHGWVLEEYKEFLRVVFEDGILGAIEVYGIS